MHNHYEDIRAIAGYRAPDWYDSNGVPRYAPFHPRLVPDIYASEAALFEIECQSCGARFLVSDSWNSTERLLSGRVMLSQRVSTWEYGDPPNARCCPPGPTMSSVVLRCVEFWRRSLTSARQWERVPELEIEIECDWAGEEQPGEDALLSRAAEEQDGEEGSEQT